MIQVDAVAGAKQFLRSGRRRRRPGELPRGFTIGVDHLGGRMRQLAATLAAALIGYDFQGSGARGDIEPSEVLAVRLRVHDESVRRDGSGDDFRRALEANRWGRSAAVTGITGPALLPGRAGAPARIGPNRFRVEANRGDDQGRQCRSPSRHLTDSVMW